MNATTDRGLLFKNLDSRIDIIIITLAKLCSVKEKKKNDSLVVSISYRRRVREERKFVSFR